MRFQSTVVTILLFAIVVTNDCWRRPRVQTVFASITNELGERLGSAFVGVAPNPEFLRYVRTTQPHHLCPAEPSKISKLMGIFHLAVYAQSDNGCQPVDGYSQDCVEHYMAVPQRDCNCGDGSKYGYHVADPYRSWSSGWKWSGEAACTTCGTSTCDEAACTNFAGCTSNDECASLNMQCINGSCSPCQCEAGQFCHNGVCGGCQNNSDCSPYICYSGTCDRATATLNAGAPSS